jgi:hypothetical protein
MKYVISAVSIVYICLTRTIKHNNKFIMFLVVLANNLMVPPSIYVGHSQPSLAVDPGNDVFICMVFAKKMCTCTYIHTLFSEPQQKWQSDLLPWGFFLESIFVLVVT